jgi:hypothetical protein
MNRPACFLLARIIPPIFLYLFLFLLSKTAARKKS